MRSYELTTGRTFGVAFDHGDDFFPTPAEFCRGNGVRHGYIPMFIAGFAEAEIVGACEKLEDPEAPVWSKVHLAGVEAMGCDGMRNSRVRRRDGHRAAAHPYVTRREGPPRRGEGPGCLHGDGAGRARDGVLRR